jgi:phosphatidylglycerophosphatase A
MAEKTERPGPLDYVTLTFATWFGTGLLPKMPGTWGTIGAIPFVWLLVWLFTPATYAVAVVAITAIAIPVAHHAAVLNRRHPGIAALNPHKQAVFKDASLQRYIKGDEGQAKDPGMIVIDEVAGFAAAMLFLPLGWTTTIVAFLLFRIFDIIKPWPVRLVERSFGGGAGIVLDDTVAGLYACLITHIGLWLYGLLNLPALP